MRSAPLFIWAVCLLAGVTRGQASPAYKQAMFNRAILEDSTSPGYVLFNLVEADGRTRVVCTSYHRLLYAIMIEQGWEPNYAASRKAARLAMSAKERRFRFTNPAALAIARPFYGEDVLRAVRQKLGGYSPDELVRQLHPPDYPARRLYKSQGSLRARVAYRDAVALVFLEKGIPVCSSDMGGELYVDR